MSPIRGAPREPVARLLHSCGYVCAHARVMPMYTQVNAGMTLAYLCIHED